MTKRDIGSWDSVAITIPEGVYVLKITRSGGSSGICKISSSSSTNTGTYVEYKQTLYIGVSPGRTYYLHAWYNAEVDNPVTIAAYYSASINSQTPSTTI